MSAAIDRLLSADQVAHRLRLSVRNLYLRARRGLAPAPFELRQGVKGVWRESDVEAFLARDGRGFSLPLLPWPGR